MSTAHDAIAAYILAQLRAAPALAGVLIEEDIEADELAEDVAQAILVSIEQSAPDLVRISGQPLDWQTTIRIDVAVRGDTRQAGVRASWARFADVFALLMANPELGGLAMAVDCVLTRTDREVHAQRIGAINSFWRVRHRTAANSLTA